MTKPEIRMNDEIRMTNDEKRPPSSFVIRHSSFIRISGFGILVFLTLLLGCDKAPANNSLTIYTSVDQPVAEPILKAFKKKTGIKVNARYDTEANKSVGLAERLRAEKDHPQADVWWGNEIFLTINLASDGCLVAYDSPSSTDIPAKFKAADHRWAASGMRVRVIAWNTSHPTRESIIPFKVEDLKAEWLKNKIVMARPVAGTTAGHVAALYSIWGDAKADAYFKALHDNGIKLVGGNSIVAQGVGSQQFWAGLTDNDDVDAAIAAGGDVSPVLPDQKPDESGTLAIPCTVGQVAGTTQTAAAHQLIDYLLSKEVEQQLIAAKFVKYSVRAGPGEIRTMDVDYPKAAAILPQATRRATAILEGRE